MSNKTYKAIVRYAGDDYFIGVPPSGHASVMDANSERNAAPTPLENLLVAVAGCTAYDVQSILQKKRQDVTDYRVEIEGVRKEDRPQAFIKFHIKHIIRGRSISEKAVADAIELSDKTYCSVAATVRPTAEITTSYEIVDVLTAQAQASA
ncbi:MAG TPA: OsmC family protein [Pyrinomonadaceae bacterium]|jgi:putative redox protein|nr:OsmC family protein [Pyrinomonadaceae bacterium]